MKKFMMIVGALVALVFVVAGCGPATTVVGPAADQPTANGATAVAAANCPDSWAMTVVTPTSGDWVDQGVPAIQQASNPDQARAAANVWLQQVKTNAGTLVGAAAYLLNKKVDAAALVGGGCATAEAVALMQELEVTLALSVIKPAQAPKDSTNTGTHNGRVVAYRKAGLGGNRKSVQITLRDGTNVWVLARCGNAVRPGDHPHIPKAPTSWECQQNRRPGCPGSGKWRQPPQDNGTSGVNTGGTTGAPAKPHRPPVNPGNDPGQPAPNPYPGGYDSGGGTGSAPGGSNTGGGSTTGGGNPVPPNPPADSGQGGSNNNTDPGGFN